jgi:hypothetical protein
MGLGIEVHSMLTLHSNDTMHRALIIELAVLLVWKENLVDVVGIITDVLPA